MTAAESWYAERTYHHADFPAERIAAERTDSVSVCLPARETAKTIGPILHTLMSLRDRGVVDQVVVVDAGSLDGTPDLAVSHGAEVYQEAALLPGYGPALGKGDAMWRSLSVLSGDLVCFVDSDTEGFGEHFLCGLLGPLVCEVGVDYVKGFYRRPFRVDGFDLPDGGGRVTELTARPLLSRFYPELAGFRQPLAGEMAGRRELLERVPFSCGYAVETALLIDVYREAGLDAVAQVDLESRQNRHQPLGELGPMAYAVLGAVTARLERDGRLAPTGGDPFVSFEGSALVAHQEGLVQRPPMASLRAAT